MRIVAGSAGGRRFAVPAGTSTRPTSDRAREAMFSTLSSLVDLDGLAVLDLYAGSGALGLEALSRGAATATFVESDPAAASVISTNAAALNLVGFDVRCQPVLRFIRRSDGGPAYDGMFDIVFAGPPYGLAARDLADVLTALEERIAPGAVVVVERSSRSPQWRWPLPLEGVRVRRYGAGTLWYGRRP